MGDFNWWRWGAYAGFAFLLLNLAASVAGFSGGLPPNPSDTAKFTNYLASSQINGLAATWLGSLSGVVFVPFLVSVRQVIRAARGDWEWSAGVVFAAGLSWTLMRIIHSGVLVGAYLGTSVNTAPAAAKLFDAAGGVGFTFVYLFGALLMVTTSYVVWQSMVLPRWTAWVGYVAAALNFIQSLVVFAGGSPFFGSPIPFANLIIGLVPVIVWAVCISIAMLGTPQARRAAQGR